MSRMNAGIILSGQQPDIVGTAERGFAAGRKNALADLFKEHGAGIASGNQNALNALAGFDPAQAVNIQSAQQQMQHAEFDQKRADEKFQLQLSEYVRGLDAEAAAQQADRIEQGIKAAATAKTPEEWDRLATQFGAADLVGRFADRDAILSRYMTAAEVLKGQQPPEPMSSAGKVQRDIEAGLLPEGTPLRGQGTTVNVTNGNSSAGLPIVDKPPKGFQRRWDADRNTYVDEPIPGGDIETERSDAAQKSDLASAGYARKADIVNSNIDSAIAMLGDKGRWVAGYGSLLSGLPESNARDFQATLDTIKANLGFEELQAMRDSSPTGGALGAISEREIAFLQAIQGNLDAAQSPDQLLSVLREIKARRAEFASERERILSKNQTAAGAADLQSRVRGMPNFQSMSDAELDAFIAENE